MFRISLITMTFFSWAAMADTPAATPFFNDGFFADGAEQKIADAPRFDSLVINSTGLLTNTDSTVLEIVTVDGTRFMGKYSESITAELIFYVTRRGAFIIDSNNIVYVHPESISYVKTKNTLPKE